MAGKALGAFSIGHRVSAETYRNQDVTGEGGEEEEEEEEVVVVVEEEVVVVLHINLILSKPYYLYEEEESYTSKDLKRQARMQPATAKRGSS